MYQQHAIHQRDIGLLDNLYHYIHILLVSQVSERTTMITCHSVYAVLHCKYKYNLLAVVYSSILSTTIAAGIFTDTA
jgi:hypothetical protein